MFYVSFIVTVYVGRLNKSSLRFWSCFWFKAVARSKVNMQAVHSMLDPCLLTSDVFETGKHAGVGAVEQNGMVCRAVAVMTLSAVWSMFDTFCMRSSGTETIGLQ